MMQYRFLTNRGALNEAAEEVAPTLTGSQMGGSLAITPSVLALVPAAVARENVVMPLSSDGETLTVAAVNPGDVMLADKLRCIPGPRAAIIEAINDGHYRSEAHLERDAFTSGPGWREWEKGVLKQSDDMVHRRGASSHERN
jgi:Type II secretion system (T2SS), protein E, N-terminal domain